jgi:TatD DNase family protein
MFIDTHCHLDGQEFDTDRQDVVSRAKAAGCIAICLPAIDLTSSRRILQLCRNQHGFLFPMLGLHPEEVRQDWKEQLQQIRTLIDSELAHIIAIGEVGLDFYWSRDNQQEQLDAFEQQVQWSIQLRLPLMIHCRKAQTEMTEILRPYSNKLPGGVFHCFTGNAQEAAQLLSFPRFMLGVGGVSTFKSSHLPDVLPAAVPLERLVLETDAPYMSPVPLRGQRNESANITHVISRLADAYHITTQQLSIITTDNACRCLHLTINKSCLLPTVN